MRNSRAVRVIELLAEAGADVRYHDPRVASIELGHEGRLAAEQAGRVLKSVDFSPAEIGSADIVVVLVAHPELPAERLVEAPTLVFDAVNALKRPSSDRIERL